MKMGRYQKNKPKSYISRIPSEITVQGVDEVFFPRVGYREALVPDQHVVAVNRIDVAKVDQIAVVAFLKAGFGEAFGGFLHDAIHLKRTFDCVIGHLVPHDFQIKDIVD